MSTLTSVMNDKKKNNNIVNARLIKTVVTIVITAIKQKFINLIISVY